MAGAKDCEGQWSDQQLQLARPTNEEAREDEGPDGSINKPMRDELWSIVPAAARKHPLLTFFVSMPLALTFTPLAIVIGTAVAAISLGIGIALLLLGPVVLGPVVVMEGFLWICYMAGRWATGLVLHATVGSENRVMMRPQASASGNEAHGNAAGNEAHGALEINLIKVQNKADGQPEQIA